MLECVAAIVKGRRHSHDQDGHTRLTVKDMCIATKLNSNNIYSLLKGEWYHSLQSLSQYVDTLREWTTHLDPLVNTAHTRIFGMEQYLSQPAAMATLSCGLCDTKKGVVISCSHQDCQQSYHPHCARQDPLLYMKTGAVKLWKDSFLYCPDHIPPTTIVSVQPSGLEHSCDVCFHKNQRADDPKSAASMLECSQCKVRVHPGCYPSHDHDDSSKAEWRCAPCKVNIQRCVCCLCQRSGGAMLRTDHGQWAHSSCAVWTPGLSFGEGPAAPGESCTQELYCLCRQPFTGALMMGCDSCGDWFHPQCIGIVDPNEEHYVCDGCKEAKSCAVVLLEEEGRSKSHACENLMEPEHWKLSAVENQPQVVIEACPREEDSAQEERDHEIACDRWMVPCLSCGTRIGRASNTCKFCKSTVCRIRKNSDQPKKKKLGTTSPVCPSLTRKSPRKN
eukprot:TRINITY_DN7703_c0_g1_i2.p1 TRINITY_DN7703_c0_g1~~TRINITY_DN7703_c0_g1_i2.p1  ORF type:complete len:446 (-),score=24.91 TRINITY_DN7703_c0_g1_i2:196-1533(-)